MSASHRIHKKISGLERGKPFSNEFLLTIATRQNVDTTLHRLIKKGEILRVRPGVYMRPKEGRYVRSVKPELSTVIKTIAKKNGEIIQEHGAQAARRFGFTTQMPMEPVYYTSGSSRRVKIQNTNVIFKHVGFRKLQNAGEPSGLALCALLYLGKEDVGEVEIKQIKSKLSNEEYNKFLKLSMPGWLRKKLNQ